MKVTAPQYHSKIKAGMTVLHHVAAAAALLILCSILSLQKGVRSQHVPNDLFMEDRLNVTGNVTKKCVTRPENTVCPDSDLHFYLYAGTDPKRMEIDVTKNNWVKKSSFNKDLPTVLLMHGYRGGDSLPPMTLLKEAYNKRGTHNVIMADWGALAKVPCYSHAINNLKPVARCTVNVLTYLQERGGMKWDSLTCVGHGLGAHLCGVLANYVPRKLERIIALDPGRPLMGGRRADGRLDSKDAKVVQVIHSNTGFYGEYGANIGTFNICINDGKQPFCDKTRNPQLCSHLHSVCYMAESLFIERAQRGVRCTGRCPRSVVATNNAKQTTLIGEYADSRANGMFCVKNTEPPYCQYNTTAEESKYGTFRCCPIYPTEVIPETTEPTDSEIESYFED